MTQLEAKLPEARNGGCLNAKMCSHMHRPPHRFSTFRFSIRTHDTVHKIKIVESQQFVEALRSIRTAFFRAFLSFCRGCGPASDMAGGGQAKATAPGIVVLHASWADMAKPFEAFIEKHEKRIAAAGLAKVIPPSDWKPRVAGYPDDMDCRIERCIKQVGGEVESAACLMVTRPTSLPASAWRAADARRALLACLESVWDARTECWADQRGMNNP